MAQHLTDPQVWSLAAGETAGGEAQAHVAACTACRTRLEEAAGVRRLTLAARAPEPSAAARVERMERFDRMLALERRKTRRWLDRRPMLLPALGLAAAAGAAAAMMVAGNHNGSMPELAPPSAVQQLATVPAQQPQQPQAPVAPMTAPPSQAVAVAPAPAPQVPRKGITPRKPAPGVAAQPLVAVAPAEQPMEAPAQLPSMPAPVGTQVTVEVAMLSPFPAVAAVREQARAGQTAEALDAAVALLASTTPGEPAAALAVVRELALQHPDSQTVGVLDTAMSTHAEHQEALWYLACEATVLGKRPAEAVERCRNFATAYPDNPRARDASYVAGTLAREALGDCTNAVEDYRKALVFTGQLGSLNDDALFWRAHCLAELHRLEEGRQDLAQFLARYPTRRVDPKVRALQSRLGRPH